MGKKRDRAHHRLKERIPCRQAGGVAPNGRRSSRVEMDISQRSSLEAIGNSLALRLKSARLVARPRIKIL